MATPRTLETVSIAERIREVLYTAGVRKGDHAKRLADVLEISLPQAYKKLAGRSEFTLAQVQLFDDAFHTSLLSPSQPGSQNLEEPAELIDAYLLVGKRLPCRARLGPEIHGFPAGRYVAYYCHDMWQIVEAAAAPVDVAMWELEFVSIYLESGTPPSLLSFGVIGCDTPETASLERFMTEQGFHIRTYCDPDGALSGLESARFDGFFIDWLLGVAQCESIIKAIRAKCRAMPIIVITGSTLDEPNAETQIAQLIRRYGVDFQTKPIKLQILAARMLDAVQKLQ